MNKFLIAVLLGLLILSIGLFMNSYVSGVDWDKWRAEKDCTINGEDCCDGNLRFNFTGYKGIFPGQRNYRSCVEINGK